MRVSRDCGGIVVALFVCRSGNSPDNQGTTGRNGSRAMTAVRGLNAERNDKAVGRY